MASRSHSQKASSNSVAPAQNTVRSRPFAPIATTPELTQPLPDLQAQFEAAQHFGHHLKDFSAPIYLSTPIAIQPKLTIGAPGDKYEREADRVAQQVVQRLQAPQIGHGIQPEPAAQQQRMPEEGEVQMKPLLQRELMPEEEEVQMKSLLQTQAGEGIVAAAPRLETAIQQSRGRGQPLAESIRQPLEQSFGNVDFSGVRVHTDAQADQLNQSIQARAFTTGQDVFFRRGAYQPESHGGQELLAHELTHVVQQNGEAISQVQRKVYIGDNYAPPTSLTKPGTQPLHNDEVVRRFKNQQEFETFAAKNELEGMGLLADNTWIRLPESMLVLGENHGDPKAPEIIQTTKIKKFRYEGFAHYSATRLEKSPELQEIVQAGNDKNLEDKGLVASDDEPTHEAEHALPKYARTVADVLELVKNQVKGEEVGGRSVAAAADLGEDYSLVKALLTGLLYALIYCKSYGGKFFSHPLKKFYQDNQAAVDAAILALKASQEAKKVPDFSRLAITPGLDQLTTAYETAAKSKLGLTTATKIDNFKATLNTKNEPQVALGDRAKENDYLRDASMLKTIKEAKSSGDRLFVIGDAHRHKLQPLIQGLGLEVMPDTDFIDEQKDLNTYASNQDARVVGEDPKSIGKWIRAMQQQWTQPGLLASGWGREAESPEEWQKFKQNHNGGDADLTEDATTRYEITGDVTLDDEFLIPGPESKTQRFYKYLPGAKYKITAISKEQPDRKIVIYVSPS